jgi:uncharacterized membrane protein required for colicin V production
MWLDIVFLFVAGIAFYRGYQAGILRAVVWVVGISLALLVTMRFAGVTTRGLEVLLTSESPMLFLIGFLLTFLLVIGLVRWSGLAIERMLGYLKIGFLNRGTGGVLFAVLATLMLALVLGTLDRMSWLPEHAKSDSRTWPVLVTIPDQASLAYRDMQPLLASLYVDARKNLEKAHTGSAED